MAKIFIDPGHGGLESGAIGNGIIEKELNLFVALKVRDYLRYNAIEYKMSREEDKYMSLSSRAKMANDWGADFFISIHHNAGKGDGYEIIHSIFGGKGKELSEAVADEFDKTGQNMRRIFSRKNKKGDADYYAVIRRTKMPAIITEYAFIDTLDYKAIDTVEECKMEARAIARGLANYLGIPFKEKIENTVPASDFENHWAKNFIIKGMDEGIFVKSKKFRPNDPLTRGEAAVIVAKLLDKINEKG